MTRPLVTCAALMLSASLSAAFAGVNGAPHRLMMTEFVVTPTAGEFVEIYNPNSFPVDLTDVYITDATFAGGDVYYYQIVTGGGGGGSFGDWFARFPAGASIGAGEFQTVSLNGSIGFMNTYGVAPTYEIWEDDAAPDAIPDMVEATPGSIPPSVGGSGLTNSGEFCTIFYWDGQSDLVVDLDYVVYGDKVEAVDKTGVSIDGPDADSTPSTYLPDTAIASQTSVNGAVGQPHASGNSAQRALLSEGLETRSGGNGITGDGLLGNDETSERTDETWIEDLPTPNAPHDSNMTLRIVPGGLGNNTLELRGATPNTAVFLAGSLSEGLIPAPCPGEGIALNTVGLVFTLVVTDGNGELNELVIFPVPLGTTVKAQAFDPAACVASNMNETQL